MRNESAKRVNEADRDACNRFKHDKRTFRRHDPEIMSRELRMCRKHILYKPITYVRRGEDRDMDSGSDIV